MNYGFSTKCFVNLWFVNLLEIFWMYIKNEILKICLVLTFVNNILGYKDSVLTYIHTHICIYISIYIYVYIDIKNFSNKTFPLLYRVLYLLSKIYFGLLLIRLYLTWCARITSFLIILLLYFETWLLLFLRSHILRILMDYQISSSCFLKSSIGIV